MRYLLLAIILAGCAVPGPRYDAPQAPQPVAAPITAAPTPASIPVDQAYLQNQIADWVNAQMARLGYRVRVYRISCIDDGSGYRFTCAVIGTDGSSVRIEATCDRKTGMCIWQAR